MLILKVRNADCNSPLQQQRVLGSIDSGSNGSIFEVTERSTDAGNKPFPCQWVQSRARQILFQRSQMILHYLRAIHSPNIADSTISSCLPRNVEWPNAVDEIAMTDRLYTENPTYSRIALYRSSISSQPGMCAGIFGSPPASVHSSLKFQRYYTTSSNTLSSARWSQYWSNGTSALQ